MIKIIRESGILCVHPSKKKKLSNRQRLSDRIEIILMSLVQSANITKRHTKFNQFIKPNIYINYYRLIPIKFATCFIPVSK